jgi:hypothetical protein
MEQCARAVVRHSGTKLYPIKVYDTNGFPLFQRLENLVAPATSHDSIVLPLHAVDYSEDFYDQEGVREPILEDNCPCWRPPIQ